jgi:hypothetical protein
MGKRTATGSLWQEFSTPFHTPESADNLTWEQYFQLLDQLNRHLVTASSHEAERAYKSLQTLYVVPTADESRPCAWKRPNEAYSYNYANQAINALLTEKKALMTSSAADWIQRHESVHVALVFAGLRPSILEIEPFPSDPESFSIPCGKRIRNLRAVLAALCSSASDPFDSISLVRQTASTATLVQLNKLLSVEPNLFSYSEKSPAGAVRVKENPQLSFLRSMPWLSIDGAWWVLNMESLNKTGLSAEQRELWEIILKSFDNDVAVPQEPQGVVDVGFGAERGNHRRLEIERAAIKAILLEEPDLQTTPTNNEGFDLFTLDESKFVEVKSMVGAWSTQNQAKLTWPQIKMADKCQDKYWIYVVEFAEDNGRRKIHRIHHPFSKTIRFGFSPEVWRPGVAEENSIENTPRT